MRTVEAFLSAIKYWSTILALNYKIDKHTSTCNLEIAYVREDPSRGRIAFAYMPQQAIDGVVKYNLNTAVQNHGTLI